MARTVSLLGQNYSVPEPSDTGYDQALTNYLVALATAFPQLNGTNSALTAEMDFGASFGLKSIYYKSRTANPAAAGQVRLAGGDSVSWRNAANAADVALAKDSADQLTWGGAYVTGNPMLAAYTTAAQSIAAGGTDVIVVFGTVERDSDSAYNSGTGRYTVPTGKGGDYVITGAINYSSAPGGNCTANIYKNGSLFKSSQFEAPGATQSIPVSAIVNTAAGDIWDIRTHHGNVGAQTLTAPAGFNYFMLKRIPT